jgi:hypothetical protein
MSVRQAIREVTDRIAARSAESRAVYLERIAAAREAGVHRAVLSCGNLAHGFAACDLCGGASLSRIELYLLRITAIRLVRGQHVVIGGDDPDIHGLAAADCRSVHAGSGKAVREVSAGKVWTIDT